MLKKFTQNSLCTLAYIGAPHMLADAHSMQSRLTTWPSATTVVTVALKGMDNRADSSSVAQTLPPAANVQGRQLLWGAA